MPREVTMIDRVARAIFRAGFHPDDSDETVEQCWTDWKEDQKPSFARARAAIEAMREPTLEMCNAGKSQEWHKRLSNGTTIPVPGFDTGPLSVWRRMIDAALSETPDAA